MKKLLILLLMGVTMSFTFNPKAPEEKISEIELNSKYCDGWASGYCEGWKDVKGSMAICPITPICPIAEIGKTEYKDGYNRGFKAGMAAARK